MKRLVARGALLAMFLAGPLSAQEPDDPAVAGPWPVGYREVSALDPGRDLDTGGRRLPIHLWYPAADAEAYQPAVYSEAGVLQLPALIARSQPPVADDQRWPLIVFSHGYQGTPTQSTPLMEILASHGFVVASVEHIGNSQAAGVPKKEREQAQADRVPDVSFVIDTLLALSRDETRDWYRRLHPFRIGVSGHSYGGSTSMGSVVGEFGVLSADPRVKAILPISGSMSYFTDQALTDLPVPLLLLGGTEDTSVPIENNSRAFRLNEAAQPVWRVDVIGAGHTHFANICAIADALIANGLGVDSWPDIGAGQLVQPWRDTCSPEAFPIADAQRLQNHYAVAFFKLHLQRDARYMRYLKPAWNQQHEPAIALWRKTQIPWVATNKVW